MVRVEKKENNITKVFCFYFFLGLSFMAAIKFSWGQVALLYILSTSWEVCSKSAVRRDQNALAERRSGRE